MAFTSKMAKASRRILSVIRHSNCCWMVGEEEEEEEEEEEGEEKQYLST
ncbi:MAG: hypothetical protein M3M87_03600 [Thermoproteota archaeon]|nr:hypothetical protein [Thermoproteota archaeon]